MPSGIHQQRGACPGPPRPLPTRAEAEPAEAGLDIEGMVRAAVEGIERVQVAP